jgi:hypothetical protein
MIMASGLTDPDKQDHFMQEAVSRITEALFRVTNSAEIAELALEGDVGGAELIRAREEREKWQVRTANNLIRMP